MASSKSIQSYPGVVTIGSGVLLYKADEDDNWIDFVHMNEVKVKIETQTYDTKNMRSGLKRISKSFTTEMKASGTCLCNAPSADNMLLFFMGDSLTDVTQSSGSWGSGTELTVADIELDKWIPLGKRDVSSLVVKVGATTLDIEDDYYLLERPGLIYIRSDNGASVVADDDLTITGSYAAITTAKKVGAGTQTQRKVHLWFVGEPADGRIQEIMGYAMITPNGEIGFISQEEETFSFDFMFEEHEDYKPALFEYYDYGEVSTSS